MLANSFKATISLGIWIAFCMACSAPGRFVISLDQSEVQAKIDKSFPIGKKKLVFEVRLESPSVSFEQDGQVEIGMQLIGLIAGVPIGKSQALITGKVGYDQDRYQFVLIDPQIKNLDLSYVPAKYTDLTRKVIDRVSKSAIPAIPIYKLDPKKHGLARFLLKRAWVSEKKLFLEMGI